MIIIYFNNDGICIKSINHFIFSEKNSCTTDILSIYFSDNISKYIIEYESNIL